MGNWQQRIRPARPVQAGISEIAKFGISRLGFFKFKNFIGSK